MHSLRALAVLLPRIQVVEGCPFNCDPDGWRCPARRARGPRAPHAARPSTAIQTSSRPASPRSKPCWPFRDGEIRHTYCDIAKARRELGFDPATPLKDGLTATWNWFLAQ